MTILKFFSTIKCNRNKVGVLAAILSACSYVSLAHAELAVVVHPSNPVTTFSQREISKLYLGRLHLFPGTSQNIILIDQQESQPSYQEFYRDLVKIRFEKLKRYRAAYLFSGRGNLPIQLSSDEKVKEYVSRHKDAIGYIDASLVDASVKSIYQFPQE
ncbi:MAG: hypothetical protein MI867_18135 [Pseudomonadales bacterium]|nr:hypothetical protein [Pseudomonadales bacterium]